MENITNGKTRRVCLPKLGSICLWIRKSKKDGAAANASVVPERVEEKEKDRTYEKMTIDEECWIREDVEGKLPHVVQYGSRTASKNGSFREEEAAVKGKDMQNQLITVRNEEKCCMSEDVEGEKLPVDYGSSISNAYGILRGKEVTSDEKPEEVAQMSRHIDEDSGETKTVVGDNKSLVQESNAVNKNSIFRVKEVIAGEGSKETTDENRDEVLAIDESLCLVEIPKDEKSDELKLIVEQGPESMYSNRTQAEHDLIPPTQDLARPVQPLPKRASTKPTPWDGFPKERMQAYGVNNAYGANNMRLSCGPTAPIRNDFNKVKTFDLRGIIKSSGKGFKSIPWPRRFSVK